ncbi:MAG: DUF2752 domain-containing protein [Mangrovibacterium sp.]
MKQYLWAFVLLGLLIGLIIFFRYNPEDNSFFPRCIFLTLTGFQCPGCGSQRAVHSLLHLQFADAWAFNPLLVLSLPYLAIIAYFQQRKIIDEKHLVWRRRLLGTTAITIIFCLTILFGVIRNLK